MSRTGRVWRLALMLVGTVALVLGTAVGSDRTWPFGSMGQYAFSVPPDGQISSPAVEADTVAGDDVRVPLTFGGIGLKRAEIEARLPDIERDPSWLQAVAVQAARRHPEWPRYARIRLVDNVTLLRDGRVAGRRHEVLAVWQVVTPDDPQPIDHPPPTGQPTP